MLIRLVYLFMVRLFGWLALLARSAPELNYSDEDQAGERAEHPQGDRAGRAGYAADSPAQAGISAFSRSNYSPVMTPVAPPVTARDGGTAAEPPDGITFLNEYERAA